MITVGNDRFAVLVEDAKRWGCPYCGRNPHLGPDDRFSYALMQCSGCHTGFMLVTESGVDLAKQSMEMNRFALKVPHPREGIPAHEKPDIRPDVPDSEFFYSRGLGLDYVPACYVCGEKSSHCMDNIAAFVETKAAGERILKMFEPHTAFMRLDFRAREPEWIQMKLGTCKRHVPNLEALHRLTHEAGKIINPGIIRESLNIEPEESND